MSPTTNEAGSCDSCGDPIRWGRLGSRMVAVNRDPSANGNVTIDSKGVIGLLFGPAKAKYTGDRYLLHKVKCRNITEYEAPRVVKDNGESGT